MIQCTNIECRADNPANAKFCRKCGTAFTPVDKYRQMVMSAISKRFAKSTNTGIETFTLDTFSNISFQPASVVKVCFVNKFVVFLFVLFAVIWFATIKGLTSEIISVIDSWFYVNIFNHQSEVEFVCLVISGLCALFILNGWIKKLRYKFNADYIEDKFVKDGMVRIARKSRMGLFDKSKNKVLLSSKYSNIEHFDNAHLLLIKGKQKGLYSLTYKKIIIPVQYDSIAQFTNSVTTVTSQNVAFHYDIKGNKLR